MTEYPVPRSMAAHADAVPSRWTLLRDVAVFQLKLFVDGLRDLVMIPISLVVAVFDLLGLGPRAGRQFYDLLWFGRRTEHWINLFGATDHASALGPRPGIDTLVDRMEKLVVQEYERGGITASAKDAVDRALDSLAKSPEDPPDPLT